MSPERSGGGGGSWDGDVDGGAGGADCADGGVSSNLGIKQWKENDKVLLRLKAAHHRGPHQPHNITLLACEPSPSLPPPQSSSSSSPSASSLLTTSNSSRPAKMADLTTVAAEGSTLGRLLYTTFCKNTLATSSLCAAILPVFFSFFLKEKEKQLADR